MYVCLCIFCDFHIFFFYFCLFALFSTCAEYFDTSFHFVQFHFIQFALHSTFLRMFCWHASYMNSVHVVVIFEILWHIYWPSQRLELHNVRAYANLQILRNILHHNTLQRDVQASIYLGIHKYVVSTYVLISECEK